MKKFSKLSNLIPILAKGDCYTQEEIREIKKEFIIEAKEHGVEWFDCEIVVFVNKSVFTRQ